MCKKMAKFANFLFLTYLPFCILAIFFNYLYKRFLNCNLYVMILSTNFYLFTLGCGVLKWKRRFIFSVNFY